MQLMHEYHRRHPPISILKTSDKLLIDLISWKVEKKEMCSASKSPQHQSWAAYNAAKGDYILFPVT